MDSEDLESFTLEPESLGECVYKTFSKCNCIQFWREREGDREGEKEGGREGGREGSATQEKILEYSKFSNHRLFLTRTKF